MGKAIIGSGDDKLDISPHCGAPIGDHCHSPHICHGPHPLAGKTFISLKQSSDE
ncbi:hypothetical protein GCM10023178_49760 [Actinomadura luteofluorescens]